jgi:hypothetical protein
LTISRDLTVAWICINSKASFISGSHVSAESNTSLRSKISKATYSIDEANATFSPRQDHGTSTRSR